jgi:hypothetical protein
VWSGEEFICRDLTAKGLGFERGPTRSEEGGVGALMRDPDDHASYFVNMPGETRKEPRPVA